MPTADGPIEMADEKPGCDPIEATLQRLLARHPEAVVAAIGGDSTPVRVPLPASLASVSEREVDRTGVLLDQVVTGDRIVLAKLWGQARTQGAAVAPIRLLDEPDNPSNLYLFDVRRSHGVILAVFTPGDDTADQGDLDSVRLPPLPPRIAHSRKDAGALVTWIDAAFSQMLGWQPEDVIGRRVIELVHPDDRELGITNWLEMLDNQGPSRSVRLRHMHRDGSWVWLEVSNENRLADPEHGDVLAEMIDISEEMEALEALHAREQLLRQLTESVPVGLFHTDLSGSLLFSNSRLEDLTGTRPGGGMDDLLVHVLPEDRSRLDEALEAAEAGVDADIELRIRSGSATVRYCTFRLRPLRNDAGIVVGLTGCVEDVTTTVRTRQTLQAQAASDQLTGCLNRTATLAVLQDVLDRENPPGTVPAGTAVIFVDLDHFKPVNDRFGHAAGDEVLVLVADRIRASLRAGDVVGRFGGDEFVVVCPGISSAEQAQSVASFLASRAFEAPMEAAGQTLDLRASLGVAWTNRRDADALTMVRRADSAMYEAKRQTGSRPVLYQES